MKLLALILSAFIASVVTWIFMMISGVASVVHDGWYGGLLYLTPVVLSFWYIIIFGPIAFMIPSENEFWQKGYSIITAFICGALISAIGVHQFATAEPVMKPLPWSALVFTFTGVLIFTLFQKKNEKTRT